VGGKSGIKVHRSVLTAVPESALGIMFSGNHQLDEVHGEIYIDRDPKVFELVIQFLKNGKKVPSMDYSTKVKFESELEFWVLQDSVVKIPFLEKLRN
jgi:hypothetical protein